MQILLGDKMQLFPKLELCRANQNQIRNQLFRLRIITLFIGFKRRIVADQCRNVNIV